MIAVALALLLACGGGGDPARYAALVGAREPTEADLAACAGLRDADLRGDCALALANRRGVRADDPARDCGAVPAGTWRDECVFQAAEHRRQQGRIDEAAKICGDAGRFVDECLYHLWQDEVSRAVPPGADLAAAGRAADAIVARWARRLAVDAPLPAHLLPLGASVEDGTVRRLITARAYKRVHEHDDPVANGACAATPHPGLCLAAAVDVLGRRAIDWRRRGGDCSGLPADSDAAAAWWAERGVRFDADPAIALALRRPCWGA